MIETLLAHGIIGFARLVTGVRASWTGCMPDPRARIYFCNHSSHGDAVLLWTVLPPALRTKTRPVAGADYWLRSRVRRLVATRIFHAVLIDRAPVRPLDPVRQMIAALEEGSSLILFPEGTRNTGSEPLLPFKAGFYHVARRCPEVELVPVWIDNASRVMPKGEFLPIPLLCTATFGAPISIAPGERSDAFLARAQEALLALAPNGGVHRP
jgi:1-acyl-sn-glycerol-3-phosphate acyltransferase